MIHMQLHVTVSFTIIKKKNIYTFQTMLFDPLNRWPCLEFWHFNFQWEVMTWRSREKPWLRKLCDLCCYLGKHKNEKWLNKESRDQQKLIIHQSKHFFKKFYHSLILFYLIHNADKSTSHHSVPHLFNFIDDFLGFLYFLQYETDVCSSVDLVLTVSCVTMIATMGHLWQTPQGQLIKSIKNWTTEITIKI